ncbi:MAG: SMI1/KNR4 family protein [Acidobacteriota bacterium]
MRRFEDVLARYKSYPLGNVDREAAREEIGEIESERGRALPGDYRYFVENFPATGLGAYTYFNFNSAERGILSVLFGAAPGDAYDFYENGHAYAESLPDEFVPIGADPGGNLICLSLGEGEYGNVLFWDRERDAFPGSSENRAGIMFCASSFSEFVQRLTFEDAETE